MSAASACAAQRPEINVSGAEAPACDDLSNHAAAIVLDDITSRLILEQTVGRIQPLTFLCSWQALNLRIDEEATYTFSKSPNGNQRRKIYYCI